jgi:hypothetical protein
LSLWAADCVGSHLWLSRPPGGPELPRASKIIKAIAVPGHLPDSSVKACADSRARSRSVLWYHSGSRARTGGTARSCICR